MLVSNLGVVFGWGMGTSKQLGTGDEEDVWEPVQMKGKQLENRLVEYFIVIVNQHKLPVFLKGFISSFT